MLSKIRKENKCFVRKIIEEKLWRQRRRTYGEVN